MQKRLSILNHHEPTTSIEVDVQAETEPATEQTNTHLYHDGLPFDPDRVCRRIQSCGQIILENIVQIGKDLIWAKRVMPHGDFTHWLRVNVGMSRQRASEFMRIAQRVLHSGTPHVRQFLQHASGGGKHKMLALLDISDEEMAEAMEEDAFLDHSIDEVKSMPVRELRAALKSEKEGREQAEDALSVVHRRVIDLEREAATKAANDDPSQSVDLSVMPHQPLIGAIEALARAEHLIGEWIEDPDLSDEWLQDGGIGADRTAAGLSSSLIQKAMNIRSLLAPRDMEH